MCTLVHTDEARVVAITRRSRTARRDARDRADERLFLCAQDSASRQLREVRSTHGSRARSRARRLSHRHSRGVTYSRLRRRSLFSPRAGSAGSAPRVRMDVRCTRGAQVRRRGIRRRTPFGCRPRTCVRTMCTLVRAAPRTRHNASLRHGALRRTRSSERAPILVCAGSGVATAARGRVPAWETRTLARSSPVASSFPRRAAPSSSSAVALQSASR